MGDSPKSNVPAVAIPKPEIMPGPSQIDSPVQIEDILATGDLVPVPGPLKVAKMPLGEFGVATANTNDQSTRLLSHIKSLVDTASAEHKKQNCDLNAKVKKGHENNIVRLVTNEFSFFTAKPLTEDEFHTLYQEILKHAATQPQNLHLVLSSFAVRTADNKLLNIVAHVECGNPPKAHCFAKNQFSSIDPIYYDVDRNGIKTQIPYITKAELTKQLGPNSEPKLDIKGVAVGFSSVFECTTLGKAKFTTCIDVCLDHKLAVAKTELQHQLQVALAKSKVTKPTDELPIQVSHVVSSNSIGMHPDYAIARITHADPYQTPAKSNDFTQTSMIGAPAFGTPVRVAITTQKPCNLLPAPQLNIVQQHTNEELNAHSKTRALDYIENTLITTGTNPELNTSQKQENAERCIRECVTSIDSLDDLQKLFEHIEAQAKLADDKPGSLKYLRKNKDDTVGYPARYENICHFIQSRALEIATHANTLNHPLIKALSDYDKNFVITTASNDKLEAAILNNSVRNNKAAQVTELLKTTSPNLCDTNGDFPLHVATGKNNDTIAEMLLQKSASPNVRNKTNQTPLELAILNNNTKMVELLLKNGASANMACSDGSSPLTFSILNGKPGMIDLLVTFGANVNARDNNKILPIEAAYLHGKNDKYTELNQLFTVGAKPSLANFAGKSFVQQGLANKDLNLLTVLSNRILFSNDEIIKHNELKNPVVPKPAPANANAAKPAPKAPDVVIPIKPAPAAPAAPASRGFFGTIADAISNAFSSAPTNAVKPEARNRANTAKPAASTSAPAAKPSDKPIVIDIELKPLPPKVINAPKRDADHDATFLPSRAPRSNASERTPFITPIPPETNPPPKPKNPSSPASP